MKSLSLLSLLSFIFGTLHAQEAGLVAAWNFDKIEKTEIVKPLERRKIPSPEVVADPQASKIVIGRIALDKLTALAELAEVRYVAPTQ